MKLLKATAEVTPVVSEEEILTLENEILRDELEVQKIEQSLEIYECILDCISKTGKVDQSLEVMFGENVSSSENFEAEIRAQYEEACEGLMDYVNKTKEIASNWYRKITADIKSFLPKFKNVKESAFPLTVKVPLCATAATYNESVKPVLDKISKAHQDSSFAITDQERAEFTKVLNATSEVKVNDSHELFNVYQRAWNVMWQMNLSNDINSKMAKTFYQKKPSAGRSFLAMQRLMERVVNKFYRDTKALYKQLAPSSAL